MLSVSIYQLLNRQVTEEQIAAYKYLQMAAWAEKEGLEGAARFFRIHSQEEEAHRDRLFDYLNECDQEVILGDIPAPKHDYAHLLEVVEAAYEHEKNVTRMIKNIAEKSFAEQDFQTFNFIQWFVAEQHEEETLFIKVLDKAKVLGYTGQSSGEALYLFDQYLARAHNEAEGKEDGGKDNA
ncbi:ferritin [Sulfurivirga caldicuralii]|uniref:Ferritin n=1 Tax=Sulfurivirga caldicuralii TaxID=364032 RepID=A0A1N6HA21_9GAMM|nr:ferritin [Sulfurivirga caldicuralii]SIO16622.1 ferritin [Sulfurivirga caldicuralii]